MTKISIAMATYNGAKYLAAQLDSIAGQTRLPDELIISDDCSCDETEVIVRSFAQTVPFAVNFSRNAVRLGYAGNFNSALIRTSGDLVFLSDQDDVWFPEKIEHMVDVAEKNPNALMVMNDAMLTDADLNETDLTKIGQIRSAGLPMSAFVMGCCCAVRRELLQLCMPIPVAYTSHDDWLVGFADGLGAKLIEQRTLQYYRRHGSSTSNFIANRIKRVNRLSLTIHDVKRAYINGSSDRSRIRLEQQKIFTNGVYQAAASAPPEFRQRLEHFSLLTGQILEHQQERARVREGWIGGRIYKACVLWLRGGYLKNSGLIAFLRDILVR